VPGPTASLHMPPHSGGNGAHGQGLTLDHFSAQLEQILTQKYTLNIP
jgi:hypothetical protein